MVSLYVCHDNGARFSVGSVIKEFEGENILAKLCLDGGEAGFGFLTWDEIQRNPELKVKSSRGFGSTLKCVEAILFDDADQIVLSYSDSKEVVLDNISNELRVARGAWSNVSLGDICENIYARVLKDGKILPVIKEKGDGFPQAFFDTVRQVASSTDLSGKRRGNVMKEPLDMDGREAMAFFPTAFSKRFSPLPTGGGGSSYSLGKGGYCSINPSPSCSPSTYISHREVGVEERQGTGCLSFCR